MCPRSLSPTKGPLGSKDAAYLAADAISMDIKRPKLKLSNGDEYDFIFEGGNFMSDGEDCVMTDKPVRDMISPYMAKKFCRNPQV